MGGWSSSGQELRPRRRILLSVRGVPVTLVERSSQPGGKMRQVQIAGSRIDAGPTVFTMRSVFEEIFAAAGTTLSDNITLRRTELLARHAWSEDARLDLFADIDRSAEAIGDFAGARDAQGYRDFCERAKRIYDSLDRSFIRTQRPSLNGLIRSFGLRRLDELWQISPFVNLWQALGEHFSDPRLRQLFGRYATYCGSSPFTAPATLMLVAHVERDGVWLSRAACIGLRRPLPHSPWEQAQRCDTDQKPVASSSRPAASPG